MSFSVNWSEREEVIAALLRAVSSDQTTGDSPELLDVYWKKNAESIQFTSPDTQARAELSTVSCVPYGEPQKTYAPDDDGNVVESISQHFVWTVRVVLYALDASNPFQALAWSERMRLGLRRDDSLATLALIDCGIQRVLQTIPLGKTLIDNREADTASFDLVMNTLAVWTSETPTSVIEHVEIEAAWNPDPEDPDPPTIDFVEIDVVP